MIKDSLLGSGFVDQSQKITVAARAMAEIAQVVLKLAPQGAAHALAFDCGDATARAMGIAGRQHQIHWAQRLFIHFGTFQQTFPLDAD
jgi:hypothetical protein